MEGAEGQGTVRFEAKLGFQALFTVESKPDANGRKRYGAMSGVDMN